MSQCLSPNSRTPQCPTDLDRKALHSRQETGDRIRVVVSHHMDTTNSFPRISVSDGRYDHRLIGRKGIVPR
jgi:hypothetical protein